MWFSLDSAHIPLWSLSCRAALEERWGRRRLQRAWIDAEEGLLDEDKVSDEPHIGHLNGAMTHFVLSCVKQREFGPRDRVLYCRLVLLMSPVGFHSHRHNNKA